MAATRRTCTGVLTRELRVRVLDFNGAGCLIETYRPMTVGSFGQLRLRLGTEEYIDDVEVLRCQIIEGAGAVYHIGMRFLWTTPIHKRSIRHAVDRRNAELFATPEMTRVMSREKD